MKMRFTFLLPAGWAFIVLFAAWNNSPSTWLPESRFFAALLLCVAAILGAILDEKNSP